MTFAGPPMGPPPGPPVVSASMVIDPGCPRRMARSATFGTTRLFAAAFVAIIPALIAGGVSHSRYRTSSDEPDFRVTLLVGLGVFVFVVLLLVGAVYGVVLPQLTRVYTLTLPPGSQLRVDYYPDRMVTIAAGVVRETFYASISRVRLRPRVIVLDRGLGAGVLPVEVVPPAAVDLLRRGGAGVSLG